jgi:carboxymethylenebutenolidase
MTALARRTLVTSIAGLPLAAVLADPRLAAMAAESLESVTTKTADGRDEQAALALPAKTPAPAVLLVHEWWGLNDQIKSVAAELANNGFVALAVDSTRARSQRIRRRRRR